MDNSQLKAAAQKELMRRAAKAELDRRAQSQPAPQQAPQQAALSDQAVPWYTPITSLPQNAYDVGAGLASAITHPEQTLQSIADIATGGITRGLNRVLPSSMEIKPQNPREQQMLDMADASGASIQDAFSSPTRAWNTIATHPVDALLTVAPGLGQAGKAAKLAGMTKTGAGISKVAGLLDPANIVTKPIETVSSLPMRAISSYRDNKLLANAPSLEDTKALANSAHNAIRDRNIQFPAKTFKPFVRDLVTSTDAIGDVAAPVASNIRTKVKRLLGPEPINGPTTHAHPMTGAPVISYPKPKPDTRAVDFNKLNELFQQAKKTAVDMNLNGTERGLAGKIASKISDYIDTVPDLKKQLADANEISRRKILAENINVMKDKSQWYVSGEDSGIRNKISSLGKREGHTMTPAEKAAYKNIVRKEGVNNLIYNAGSRMGGMLVPMAGATMGSSIGLGPIGGVIASNAIHLSARAMSEARTIKALDKAQKTVLLGKDRQKLLGHKIKTKPLNKNAVRGLLVGTAVQR